MNDIVILVYKFIIWIELNWISVPTLWTAGACHQKHRWVEVSACQVEARTRTSLSCWETGNHWGTWGVCELCGITEVLLRCYWGVIELYVLTGQRKRDEVAISFRSEKEAHKTLICILLLIWRQKRDQSGKIETQSGRDTRVAKEKPRAAE